MGYCFNFDNAADTPVCPEARQALLEALSLRNPSSLHAAGRAARACLEESRDVLREALGCERLVFTSGGTESVNLALRGAAETHGNRKKHIVTTTLEHPATVNTLSALKARGFTVSEVPPRSNGRAHPADIASAVTGDTFLVTVIQVAGETGSLQDVSALAALLRERTGEPPILHVDAVQGFLKYPLHLQKSGVDLMSVSGHKVHAPAGVGALAASSRVRLAAQHTGGSQEEGLRGGTEPLPLIAAFAAAVKAWTPIDPRLTPTAVRWLQDAGWTVIPAHDAPIVAAANPSRIPGEAFLRMLSDKGVLVGTGSACSRGKRSKALASMRLPPEVADSVIRLSFSRLTTMAELAEGLGIITGVI